MGLVGSLALGFVSMPLFTRMFSVADYMVDVTDLGFADVVGGENERRAG